MRSLGLLLLLVVVFPVVASAGSVMVVGDDNYFAVRFNVLVYDSGKVYAFGFTSDVRVIVVYDGINFTVYELNITRNTSTGVVVVYPSYLDSMSIVGGYIAVYGGGFLVLLNKTDFTVYKVYTIYGIVRNVYYNGTHFVVLSTRSISWFRTALVVTVIDASTGSIVSVKQIPSPCISYGYRILCYNFAGGVYNGTHIISVNPAFKKLMIYDGAELALATLPFTPKKIVNARYVVGRGYVYDISTGKLYQYSLPSMQVTDVRVDGNGNIIVAGLLDFNDGDIFVMNITSAGVVAYSKMLIGDYGEFRPKVTLNGTHILVVGTTRSWGSTSRYGDEDIMFIAVSYTDAPRNLTFNFSTTPPTYANQPEWIDTPLPYVSVSTSTLTWKYMPVREYTLASPSQVHSVTVTASTVTAIWKAIGVVSTASLGQPIVLRPIIPVPKPPKLIQPSQGYRILPIRPDPARMP